jgi:hypothetical protein
MSMSRKLLRLSPLIHQNALRLTIIFAVHVAQSTVASTGQSRKTVLRAWVNEPCLRWFFADAKDPIQTATLALLRRRLRPKETRETFGNEQTRVPPSC